MIKNIVSQIIRFPSHEVKIGDRPLGGRQPIRLQSMTSTDTMDVVATVAQSIRIIEAGADYVRIAAPSMEAAGKLKEIKKEIRSAGLTNPLVADIHFNAEVAMVAATIVEKIRINPGNYTGGQSRNKTEYSPSEIQEQLEKTAKRLEPLLRLCRENGTAIRIGTNLGSLSPRIISQYGNTPQGMVESTFEFLQICREFDFHDIVISLKASKPLVMIQAYEGMVEKMMENNMTYPLHIGITEAGEGENGRIKSALGICSLLNKGIGDTLRVSLTEDPEFEIPFSRKIANLYQDSFTKKTNNKIYKFHKTELATESLSVFNDNIKAIVIKDSDSSRSNISSPKAESSYQPVKGETFQLIPDLLYYEEEQVANAHRDSQHFNGAKKWFSKNDSLNYPIFALEEFESGFTYHTGDYFLEIPPLNNPENILMKVNEKPLALITDPDSWNDHKAFEALLDFSQKKRIPIIIKRFFESKDEEDIIAELATLAGTYLISKKIQGIWIKTPDHIRNNTNMVFGFLQSSGLRITRTEFISCPTCARTSYELQKVLLDIKERTSHIPGLKIAVMGCVVNGPGEMADADYGYVGAGNGKIHLYKGKNPVKKNIDPEAAVDVLMDILKENGYY